MVSLLQLGEQPTLPSCWPSDLSFAQMVGRRWKALTSGYYEIMKGLYTYDLFQQDCSHLVTDYYSEHGATLKHGPSV